MNGTVSTSGRFYFPGERVAYKCLEGFVLFGADERTCHKNGTWSDEVPLCGECLVCLVHAMRLVCYFFVRFMPVCRREEQDM